LAKADAAAGLSIHVLPPLSSSLHQRVRRTIRRHALCPPGTRLIIGLSGGSDSVALTLLLRDLADRDGFTLASLAHFNHQIRPTAARDEQFCRDLAARLGLPIVIDSVDVKIYATSQRLSLEDAARRLRYDFLERAAHQAAADRVAVGHTEDDQAETYLIKLIRGAGLTGLGGIYPRRGRVIRPLLDVSRLDLRDYLASRGEAWVEDETNADLDNPRNRIRHQVLPELDRVSRGRTRPAIARAAALAREDGQWLDGLSVKRAAGLATTIGENVHIDAAGLAAEPEPVQRRVLLLVMRSLAGDREIGLDHVESVRDVLAGITAAVDIPGSRVELQGKKLVLVRQGART
jgi:tRNA(Ile)-lysidine synthase